MGNWNNLSMRDKREVMRLHIKNGIRDLDGIRESYNAFADGGDTSVISYGTKLKVGEPIDKSGAKEEQLYINNWLKSRKNTGNYNDQLGGLEYNRQITNMYNAEEVDPVDFYYNINKKYRTPGDSPYNDAIELAKMDVEEGVQGKYSPDTNQISTRYSQNIPSTRIHEWTHSLNATPQESLIQKYIPITDEYLDSPTEIYSRLMQMRKRNNLDPNKNYSFDEIKKMIKNKSSEDYNFLDRYTLKQLHFLINRVAQNNQQLPDNFLNNNIT